MLELGALSGAEHQRIGQLAAALGLEVVSVGAPDYGVGNVDSIEGTRDILIALGDGDALLIKASRAAGLERLAARVVEDATW
jgi:UDP-N-acetylmuramoyl-tripeptide--D-alanyl-D-alanine ligase